MLTLVGNGIPAGVWSLYFQGTALAANGSAFGDDRQCAVGTIVRLGTKTNDASGNSQCPAAGDQPISVRGMLPAGGGSRGYQVCYRNAASLCTSSMFNLTNGMYAQFAP